MASVTSLDSDMRTLRLSKYTPAAANRVRDWIEEVLGQQLPSGDLLDALKDGVTLCKLVNLVLGPPGLKYKQSQMPFVQMENISHFLKACELPPLSMPSHDRFLTVDLYESKDPAQVLQCLSAFSRVAHNINPSKFPTSIDGRRAGAMSPNGTGSASYGRPSSPLKSAPSMPAMRPSAAMPTTRPLSPTKTGGSTTSSNTGPISSWANKSDHNNTAPAWNIHQYGYMGGASQGNQGVMFGGRRQITSASPQVPSLAEKEKKRKEKEAEEQRQREEAEEEARRRREEEEAEEERMRVEEEQRWEKESRRLREEERHRLDEQKRQWEEQERKWKLEEEARQREEAEEKKMRPKGLSDARLNGQYLSQYQSNETPKDPKVNEETPEGRRVKELERQLEEARERERQYQLERGQRPIAEPTESVKRVDSVERPSSAKESEVSWAADERESLRQAATQRKASASTRPLPDPVSDTPEPSTRPLPDPSQYQPKPQVSNRTDQFLAQNKPPIFQRPRTHQPAEMGFTSTAEEQTDRDRRIASQDKTKAGGWASKSLLEREMERERERQKEWEASQEATKAASRDVKEGSAPGHTWNVNQYGFTGGDSQNKGSSSGSGIAMGGRRQIIGPRPQPGAR